jgi:uncharacterized protein YegJ (DUF2314 family)
LLAAALGSCDRSDEPAPPKAASAASPETAAAATAPGAAPGKLPYDERAGVTLAPADSAPLLSARADARGSLPHFWRAWDAGAPASDFGLKVSFDTSKGDLEHIWTNDIRREGRTITAVVANTPIDLPTIRPGQRVTVDPDRIFDWTYTRDGKLYGHFSSRVLLDTMPPAEAAEIRAMFSAQPLPPGAG